MPGGNVEKYFSDPRWRGWFFGSPIKIYPAVFVISN